MFGALYGDVIGSYYEFHSTKNYDFALPPFGTFTDDSVLTAAVCRVILNDGSAATRKTFSDRAVKYAEQIRLFYSRFPSAGFGSMFSEWAKSGSLDIVGSYGNGAAMRVIPIACAYNSLDEIMLEVKASCYYTHHSREAAKGAMAVAHTVYLARRGASMTDIKSAIEKKYGYDLSHSVSEVRAEHVFSSRASYTVPAAIISFLGSHDYESAVRNAVSLGGDADTEACIAGGIAEAFYGEIPECIRNFCEEKIDSTIRTTIREFEDKYN